MGKLRVLAGLEVCKILEQNGFISVRQRGSHRIMQLQTDGTTVTVPVPLHDPVRRGILQSIIRQLRPRCSFGATIIDMDVILRKYTCFDEMKADEYRYWQSRPVHERMDAAEEMIQAAYALKGWEIEPDGPRLQRPFVRIPCPWR